MSDFIYDLSDRSYGQDAGALLAQAQISAPDVRDSPSIQVSQFSPVAFPKRPYDSADPVATMEEVRALFR